MGDPTAVFSLDCAALLQLHPFSSARRCPLIKHQRLTIPAYDTIVDHHTWVRLRRRLVKGTIVNEKKLQELILAALKVMSPEGTETDVEVECGSNFIDLFETNRAEWARRREVQDLRRQFDRTAAGKEAAEETRVGRNEEETVKAAKSGTAAKGWKSRKAGQGCKSRQATRPVQVPKAPQKRPRQSAGVHNDGTSKRLRRAGSAGSLSPSDTDASAAHFWDDDAASLTATSTTEGHYQPGITVTAGQHSPYHVTLSGDFRFEQCKRRVSQVTHREGFYQVISHVRIARSFCGARLGILFCNGFFQRLIVLDDESIAVESISWDEINRAASSSAPNGRVPRRPPAISVEQLDRTAAFWEAPLPNALIDPSSNDYDERSRGRLVHFVAVALYMGTQTGPFPVLRRDEEAPLHAVPVLPEPGELRPIGGHDNHAACRGADGDDRGSEDGGGGDGACVDQDDDGDSTDSVERDGEAGFGDVHDEARVRTWLANIHATPTPEGPRLSDTPSAADTVAADNELLMASDAESFSLLKDSGNVHLCLVAPSELDQLVYNLSTGRPVALEALIDPVCSAILF